ncbi:MAG: response regulator transcription factor [Syntrophothermus sp.]
MGKILIIDDSAEIIVSLVDMLQEAGHETYYSYEAVSGIKLARDIIPDLIICDILMPQMDGFEYLREIKEDPSTAHIPFIFMSARASKSDIAKGMNAGAARYIVKPFDILELSGIIEHTIQMDRNA